MAVMLAGGFKTAMLNGLVRDGLATTTPRNVRAGKRSIEVVPDDDHRRWAAGARRLLTVHNAERKSDHRAAPRVADARRRAERMH
jgi:hypothetical protein